MSKQARGAVGCAREAPITPSLMQLVTYVLGNCAAGGVAAHGSAESEFTALSRPTVDAVQGILQGLSQREEQIVRMRYGIGTQVRSAHEISEQLGVMPHQIERIELRVFRKLRESSMAGAPRRPVDADCEVNPWDEA